MHFLDSADTIHIRQVKEIAEFFGFECANSYEILVNGARVMMAAEQSSGIFAVIGRQMLGHWRAFDLIFTSPSGETIGIAQHPFRFIFPDLTLRNAQGIFVGKVTSRFSVLKKRLTIETANGITLEMSSPLLRIWTFPVFRNDRQVAIIKKKWSGLAKEMFLDADNFELLIEDPAMSQEEKFTLLAAALLIDLKYFEDKASLD